MSIDKHIYIGPYAAVPRQEVKKEVDADGCPKCQADFLKSPKLDFSFCPKCGSQRAAYKKIIAVDKVDVWNLHESMGQRLFSVCQASARIVSETEDFWLPNVKIPGIERKMNVDDMSAGATPMWPCEIAKVEMAEFIKFFDDDLYKMGKAYGQGQVEIKWGLVIYYS
jgi:hypothetical protein